MMTRLKSNSSILSTWSRRWCRPSARASLKRLRDATMIAKGYNRVVYGDHGPYVVQKTARAFYDERYTTNPYVKLYEQKKSVKGVRNPPPGLYSKNNNRPEGYADYQPYI